MITIDQLVPHPPDLLRPELDGLPLLEPDAPSHPPAPIVIYDDFHASHRARQLLASMTHQHGEEMEVRPAFWRFDLLEHPSGRCQALADATEAKLLIVSASGEGSFPPTVAGWLKACLAEKQGTGTAVFALLGPPAHFDEPDSPRLQFLKKATTSSGLDFYAVDPHPADLHPATFENLHQREEAITPTLNGILHHAQDVVSSNQ